MLTDTKDKTKYEVKITSDFKKNYKNQKKQNKDINKLKIIIQKFANKEELDDKKYKNCFDCHIEPDWILIYSYKDKELVLLLVNTGSHSIVFK